MRHLRRLTTTILVTMLLVSGTAAAQQEEASDPPPSVLANVTLSCSAAAPSLVVGCWVEGPVLALGPVEFAVGLDAQAALTGGLDEVHVAPFAILAYYAESWSVWGELRLPDLPGVPTLGSPDWLRIGFTYRFE